MADVLGLGTQLRRVTASLDGDVQALYDELGVPFRPRFFPIVQHLLANGATAVSALARVTGVSQPAATQTVAEMAKVGLVAVAGGADARERLVRLTPAGLRLTEQLGVLWNAVSAAATELDSELPQPLSTTLSSTLAALAREPFKDRIRRKMKVD